MRIVFLSIGILCLLYFLFLFCPGYMAFFTVFKHKKGFQLTEESMKGTYYEPFTDRILSAKKEIMDMPYEELWLETRDKVKLYGRFIDCGSDKTVIFSHGYKADFIDQLAVAGSLFKKESYNLLFTCNRGHGKSGGKYTSLGMLECADTLEWIQLMENRGCKRLALYGVSMGCVAVSFAIPRMTGTGVKVAVLDCGFDSVRNQMTSDCRKWHIPRAVMFPALSVQAKLRLGVDFNENIRDAFAQAKLPAIFIHGKADESVAFSCGQANFEAYSGPKESIFTEGADHTVALLAGGEPAEKQLINFVNNYI